MIDASDGSLTPGQRMGRTELRVDNHEKRIDDLEAWRYELRGAFGLLRFAIGSSLVSGALGILSIIVIFATLSGQP